MTALTDDPRLERDLLGRHEIGRLNLGPVPTSVLQWDQPHEGNIFTHLYQQRAFQKEAPQASSDDCLVNFEAQGLLLHDLAMSDRNRTNRTLMWILFAVLVVLHYDFWFWSSGWLLVWTSCRSAWAIRC